jgi:hypothetical protein
MAVDPQPIEIRTTPTGVEFAVKVVPGASRSRVAGVWNGALRVQVSAPPEGGRANRELIRLLAAALGVKRADVALVSGATQPRKRIALRGLSEAAFRARIASG